MEADYKKEGSLDAKALKAALSGVHQPTGAGLAVQCEKRALCFTC